MLQRCVQGRVVLSFDHGLPRRIARENFGIVTAFNILGAGYLCRDKTMGMTGKIVSGGTTVAQ